MIQKKHFGRDIPAFPPSLLEADTSLMDEPPELFVGWERVASPVEGDALLMGFRDSPNHIGVAIKDGYRRGALHCIEKVGVVFTDRKNLERMGWRIRSVWRWRGQ